MDELNLCLRSSQVLKATGAVLLHHERAAEASTGAADADKASPKSALPLFELDHESVFVTFTLFRMLEKPKHKPLIMYVMCCLAQCFTARSTGRLMASP